MITISILTFLTGLYLGATIITFIDEYNEAVIHNDIPVFAFILASLFWPYKYFYK